MSSTTFTSLTDDPSQARPLLGPRGWAWVIGLGILFILVHFEFFRRTAMIYTTDVGTVRADWSHIIAIPFISAYYIYQKRDRLRELAPRVCWWGLPILFAGLFSYIWWIFPGRNDMMRGYSMVVALFGLVLLLLGPQMMRVLWFPVLFLVFAVKVSDALWERIANMLQDIAAIGATFVLKLTTLLIDFNVEKDGNTIKLANAKLLELYEAGQIHVYPYAMNVAEACSGLRMLMAFIALGVAMAFLFDRPWWQRLVMVGMSVPIAVGVNIGRVTAIGLLALHDPALSKGDFHTLVGMLMLIPAVLLFLLLGWVMDRIVVSPEPEHRAAEQPPPDPLAERREAPPVGAISPMRVARGALAGLLLIPVVGLVYWGMLNLPPAVLDALPFLNGHWGALARVLFMAAVVAALIPVIHRVIGGRQLGGALGLCVGILGAWFVTQSVVIQAQGAVIVKDAVPLRHELFMIPESTASWQVVHRDPPLSKEIEEALGTKKYLSWYYLDKRMASPDQVDVRRRDFPEGSVVRLHLAYYTGGIDTVPHVPERCNVAGGFQAIGNSFEVPIDIDNGRYEYNEDLQMYETYSLLEPVVRTPRLAFDARAFTYAPPNRSDAAETVVYFFIANGKYLASPLAVRAEGFDLRDRHAYYFKVQAEALGVSDPDEARRRVEALLSDLMPQVLAALPDWSDVQAGRYPAPAQTPPADVAGGATP